MFVNHWNVLVLQWTLAKLYSKFVNMLIRKIDHFCYLNANSFMLSAVNNSHNKAHCGQQ